MEGVPSCYLLSCNTDIHCQWVGSFLGNTQNSTKINVQSTCKGAAWKARCPAGGSTRSGVVVAVMYKVPGEKRTGGLGGFVAFEISGNGGVGGSGINIKSQILRALHGVIHIHPTPLFELPSGVSYHLPPHPSIPRAQTYWISLKGTYIYS